jgi:hypothetical protein
MYVWRAILNVGNAALGNGVSIMRMSKRGQLQKTSVRKTKG